MNQIKPIDILFVDYFKDWIFTFKKGAVKDVTFKKYLMSLKSLSILVPNLKISDINRNTYQKLINKYALTHEKQTVHDFHYHLKSAFLDAVDDGYIKIDPTRKVVIKGKAPSNKKVKFLSHFELQMLLRNLDLGVEVTWDWLILLIAKTGLRFSEALAITPNDFDFAKQILSINKTWDYKGNSGFQSTKNNSSVRKIRIDWQLSSQFASIVNDLEKDKPIFVNSKVYNSTVNNILHRHCNKVNIPVISIHGLRHTHASILLYSGVSIASVARRLGHSNITTTQNTYLHIIAELESHDTDLIIRSISTLT